MTDEPGEPYWNDEWETWERIWPDGHIEVFRDKREAMNAHNGTWILNET